MTRSIRWTASPQLWAMSVALLAHGDTVPQSRRHDDQRAVGRPRVGVAVAQQRVELVARLRAPSGASLQTQCTCRARDAVDALD